MNMDWPRPNERLFRSTDVWQLNACINCYGPSLGAVARSYREGAEALADAAGNEDATLDCVILPIAFLYRQYLELKIKEIIETAHHLIGEKGYPTHHKLKDLWAEALGLLRKQYGYGNPPELAHIQPCIDEFHEHDEKSMAFRYPTDKDGNRHLERIAHINLANLYETMERIGNLLDRLADDLSHRYDCICEMMASEGGVWLFAA